VPPGTPTALDGTHVERLRAEELDDFAISDALHGAAFFNWANRLLLSLGERPLCSRLPLADSNFRGPW